MATHIVDLRSDTVTKPNKAMRQAMANAEVGDDVYREDPTIKALEKRCAQLLGKQDSLFVPSGTMANLIACMCHCDERGCEMIIGDRSHIALCEQGNVAQLAGVFPRIIPNQTNGTLDFDQLKMAINSGEDVHSCKTKLICLENTHNFCGGKILPMEFLEKVYELAQEKNILVHFDGARLLNASVGLGVEPAEITKYCDTVSLCLSKGVGAPVGSVIAGTSIFIQRALRCRKSLGGGMRQAGVLAAACMVGLDKLPITQQCDHRHAKQIAEAIKRASSGIVKIRDEEIQTNMIFLKLVTNEITASNLCARLHQVSPEEKNAIDKEIFIKCSSVGSDIIRLVTNCNVSDADVKLVIEKFTFVLEEIKTI